MANLDTATKRGSAVQAWVPWSVVGPFPSLAPGQADRQWMAHSYSGILASAPAGFKACWAVNSNIVLGAGADYL